MTEKEKMLAGELYDHRDPELVRAHKRAVALADDFNRTAPEEDEQRREIIKKLLRARGEVHIERPFRCDYGFNITVGDHFFANYDCVILDVCAVDIGDDVMLAPGVHIYTATHPLNPQARRSRLEYGKPVRIGNNVWIGGCSVICPGVSIGDNCVIGAGSIVTRDIPADSVAAGNPARVIKRVFDE
jgi:maltose O-acetyltransferase